MLAIPLLLITWLPPERTAEVATPPLLITWLADANTVVAESAPKTVSRPPELMVPEMAVAPRLTVWIPAD